LRGLLADLQSENLDPCYLRLPGRALRIAALLTSVNGPGGTVIHLPQWARAPQIVERWRRALHHLIDRVEGERPQDEPLPHKQERQVTRWLQAGAPLSLRALQHKTGYAQQVLVPLGPTLVHAGLLEPRQHGKTTRYAWLAEPHDTE
jgi:hypothetical protein